MAVINITSSLRRREIVKIIRSLPARLVNEAELQRRFAGAMAYSLFSRIYEAFLVKSGGGTDDLGYSWKPLSPLTIALRPIRKDDLAGLGLKGTGKNLKRGLLNPAQDKQWRGIYASRHKRLLLFMGEEEAKALAAKVAWTILKSQGAPTRLTVLGQRKVPILIDSGRLVKSITPGRLSHLGAYTPRNPDQVFEVSPGLLRIGSRVPYAAKQNKTRRFIPAGRRVQPYVSSATKEAIPVVVQYLETRCR